MSVTRSCLRWCLCLATLLLSGAVVWASVPGEEAGRDVVELSLGDLEVLEELAKRLADREAPDRQAAIIAVIDLASQFQRVPLELEQLIRGVASDSDPRVSGPAAAWTANRERRMRGEPPPPTAERTARLGRELARTEAELEHPNAQVRRQALGRLLHFVLSETWSDDPAVRGLFERAGSDSAPQVRTLAAFALRALDGDESALHEIHVGAEPGDAR